MSQFYKYTCAALPSGAAGNEEAGGPPRVRPSLTRDMACQVMPLSLASAIMALVSATYPPT
jgi:hypothetical protein